VSQTVPDRADAVIVGGGVIGCSIAYHLAARGLRVVLCERETLGSQSTGRCAGGVRQQFSSETNVRMQRLSVAAFTRFEEEVGSPLDFRQIGYLFLLSKQDDVEVFRSQLRMWHRLGLTEARWVTPEEARELSPAISTDGVVGGTFCPSDGIASPNDATAGYAGAARRLGATVLEGCAVHAIDTAGGRVQRVQTSAGPIATELVFDCAGAWSAEVAAMAGVTLPVAPYPRHVFVTEHGPQVPRDNPMTIDFETSLYFHPEGDGVLFGMGERDEVSTFATVVDWGFLEKVERVAARRVPALLDAGIRTGWVGLYESTPDHQPFLGTVDEAPGLWCACGFSGHGFQMAPAVGRLLAQLLLDGRSEIDIDQFSPRRVLSGLWQPEHNVV
jgi:glycine/D-amino acid oxidase-like deaminating enzyme